MSSDLGLALEGNKMQQTGMRLSHGEALIANFKVKKLNYGFIKRSVSDWKAIT